jgi:hypothetical protein
MKPNFYELQDTHRNFKKGTEVPERKLRPLVGPLVERNIFLSSPITKNFVSQMISVCGRYQCQTILHIAATEVTYTK